MRALALDAIPYMATLKEAVFWFEEKPDADTRRKIEKRAEKSVRQDAPKKEKDNSVFSLAEALQSGDKKRMWIEYQSALAKGNAPEAIHGILFWGAKKILLTAHTGSAEWKRGTHLSLNSRISHTKRVAVVSNLSMHLSDIFPISTKRKNLYCGFSESL